MVNEKWLEGNIGEIGEEGLGDRFDNVTLEANIKFSNNKWLNFKKHNWPTVSMPMSLVNYLKLIKQ